MDIAKRHSAGQVKRAVEHADMKTQAADLTQLSDDKLEEVLAKK